MKSQRLKFKLIGNDRALCAEVIQDGIHKGITVSNNRVSIQQLIAALQHLENEISGEFTEHSGATEGAEEVQRETGTEETACSTERSPQEDGESR
jgi:hypothetical protein